MHKRLDTIGGLLGFLAGASLAYLGYVGGKLATAEIGLAIVAPSLVYLAFQNRITSSSNAFLPETKRLLLMLNIVFFCAFAASIHLMHCSIYRPFFYFVLTSISVAAVAMQTLCHTTTKGYTYLLLIEILLISFSLRYGLLYEFPEFYGVDPWDHSLIVESWLDNARISHHIPTGFNLYADFPIMHLDIVITRLTTLLSPKDSFFMSIGLFYIFSILFVFLFGRSLVDTKTGILCALFVSFNQFHVSWGAWIIAMSLGLAIFAMLLWLVFSNVSNSASFASLITIIMSIILLRTHTIAAFITALVLTSFFVTGEVYKRVRGTQTEGKYPGYNLVLFFWVALLATWIYSFYSATGSFFHTVFGFFVEALRVDVQYVCAAFQAAPTYTGTLNRMGLIMLIGLIVMGSLCWLSPKLINNRRLAVVIGSMGISLVCFGFPVFNIGNLLPNRWLGFIAVLAAPLAVGGTLALSRVFNSRVAKLLLPVLIIFIFCMFMVNSSGVNTCTPFYGRDYMHDPHRSAYTTGELAAADTIAELYDGQITTDNYYACLPFRNRVGTNRLTTLNRQTEAEGLIAIREYTRTHEVIQDCTQEQYERMLATFGGSRYNTVYNNGKVEAYLAK